MNINCKYYKKDGEDFICTHKEQIPLNKIVFEDECKECGGNLDLSEYKEVREECIEVEIGKNNKPTYKINISPVVNFLINKFSFKTVYATKHEEIYVYSGGIYILKGREVIQASIEKILGQHCTNHFVREIEEKIKRQTVISREDFDNIPEELICLNNGILNLKTQQFLEEHDPKYLFRKKINITFDKTKKCNLIEKFLSDVLYPEHIPIIQEWFGYNLYRRYFIKKALILFGGQDTGKSVLVNLLSTFIGHGNFGGLSLQTISSGDKFALASLYQMYSNIKDDLQSGDLISGGFKEATGGSWLTAEKKFGDRFSFLCYAKHTFTANKIPSLKNIDVEDSAYYMRWLPIPLDNKIETKDQDKFLIDKLTAKDELSGLLNWALIGLKRLLDKGVFSYNKTVDEIRLIMEKHGDSLSAFVQDILIREDGNKITKQYMYKLYTLYINSLKPIPAMLSKEQIGRKLNKYATYIIAKHKGKVRYWDNVNLNLVNIKSQIGTDTFDTFTKTLCN